ncbi:hypothetical protein [Rhizobium alvei]|uniref:Transcriptional regulator n=1 Tax=Rhizobium alvei TaxID=1132659 RepID=A0ABT8YGA8_9HYPH|nr:hypothetical protein [Rhizobium alvei]MDO6962704.1 hypothetical protein [Rhizobium alvei]
MAKSVAPRKRLKEIKQEVADLKAKLVALKAEREELRAKVKAAMAAKAANATEPKA